MTDPDCKHEWKDVCYGTECIKCGKFYADGCAPWDSGEPRECCGHCGKEFEDWSDLGCEYCDARHPCYGIVPV